MPPVTRSRGLRYAPIPFDMEMVREGLLREGTVCEYIDLVCNVQAVTAHLGTRAVAFLCQHHADMVAASKPLAVSLERHMFSWFNEMFNIYRINERMGGTFSAAMDTVQEDIKKAVRTETVTQNREQRALIAEMNALIKIGAPDDALAHSRREQSPSRDLIQPVFRNPDSDDSGSDLIPVQLI